MYILIWCFNMFYQIYNKEEDSLTSLECNDQSVCNWMIFVRPASYITEQNVIAYQYQGCIYYKSVKVYIII